jgi:hypothetical protein
MDDLDLLIRYRPSPMGAEGEVKIILVSLLPDHHGHGGEYGDPQLGSG